MALTGLIVLTVFFVLNGRAFPFSFVYSLVPGEQVLTLLRPKDYVYRDEPAARAGPAYAPI